jgi:hypothetical protein
MQKTCVNIVQIVNQTARIIVIIAPCKKQSTDGLTAPDDCTGSSIADARLVRGSEVSGAVYNRGSSPTSALRRGAARCRPVLPRCKRATPPRQRAICYQLASRAPARWWHSLTLWRRRVTFIADADSGAPSHRTRPTLPAFLSARALGEMCTSVGRTTAS